MASPVGYVEKAVMESWMDVSSLRKEEESSGIFSEGKILPRGAFLQFLRMEKKRAARTGEPFSLALFYLETENPSNGKGAEKRFLNHLIENSRETDLKGHLGKNAVAVLLPATNEAGLRTFSWKILRGIDAPVKFVSGTYPHSVFDRLLENGEEVPDLFPLDLDERDSHPKLKLALKRGLDILGSALGLILLSPLMLVIALLVKWSSPGPVLFRQTRLGWRGKRFSFYKFRSMYWKSDESLHRKYVTELIAGGGKSGASAGREGKGLFKLSDDPRVTPLGRFLRRLSLDELPQLFNVLKGEMSLVGPRPPIAYEVEKYQPWHLRRILEMKPGMTGLWQVSGRSRTTFEEMVRLDLRYAKQWSLWLDLKILFRTAIAVFNTRNVA